MASKTQCVFICYHENKEDTAYNFNRIIIINDRHPTICDGWNYKYIGQITADDNQPNDTASIIKNINDNLVKLHISCDYHNFYHQ
jgi:hypothetical protein